MKKLLIIFLFLISGISYSQELYRVKFYLSDGDLKSYKIDEIENININTLKAGYLLKLFYNQTETADYTAKDIESIKFETDTAGKKLLSVYISGNPESYFISGIDSIIFLYSDEPAPEITDISPKTAKIGDEIKITGNAFGDDETKGYVAFKGINAKEYISWTNTEIKLKVPNRALNGKVFVRVNNIKSNEIDFKIIPKIAYFSKSSATVGESVTINGSGFGITKATNNAVFNTAVTTTFSKWNDSTIILSVPKGAMTGKAYVISDGIESNKLDFTILPKIESITPTAARLNDTINIYGSGFGSAKDTNKVILSNLTITEYNNWSDTLIGIKIPFGAKNGKIYAMIGNRKSNEVDFYIIPVIEKITPDTAGISEDIVLTGQSFGSKQDKSFISFNEIKAVEYKTWSDTYIKVTVPEEVESGKVTITVADQKSNEVDFNIKHHISALNPTSFKIGDEITIAGTNFNSISGQRIVLFNDVEVTEFLSWADKEIKVKVPVNTLSGKLSLKIGTVKSNELNYSIIPNLLAINPNSAYLGSTVKLAGKGFGAEKGNSSVTFQSGNANVYDKWSSTEIDVQVPNGARTGKVYITVNNIKSNEFDFTVLPSIISINPTGGAIGDIITITGASFGETRGTSTVSFSGADATEYTSWNDAEIKVKVPNGTQSGKLYLTVNQVKSNEVNFNIRPSISGISPNSASRGDFITISGSGFGASRGTSTVTFYNNKSATEYQSWSNTQIVVKVPNGSVTGIVYVTVNSQRSNDYSYTINAPVIEEVTIGTQTWMLKNLDVVTYRNGDTIPQVTDNTEWWNLTSGAWCYYDNDQSNNDEYGKLYNWHAVGDARCLCPEGWHVPTNDEFNVLFDYLGGTNVAGGKMKETGFDHWDSPNTNATNESGFSAVGAGNHWTSGYTEIKRYSGFWSSTIHNETWNGYFWNIRNTNGSVQLDWWSKKLGKSVRCIKD